MRTGIISINLYTHRLNYGAVLHSWYFQKLMLSRGDIDSCEIVDYPPRGKGNYNPWTHFLTKKKLKNPLKFAGFLLVTPGFARRYKRFQAFYRAHLTISQQQYDRDTMATASLPYDMLFFESDVIWSPSYFGGTFDPVFFGALPSMKDIRKIVYSASMSDAKLSSENLRELDELLKYPDAISIRERYAAEIVRAHTDKPVADVIDPVLLAEPEDFDEITAPRQVRGKYVLMYYPVRPHPYVTSCAREYAKKHGYRLVEVSIYPDHKLTHRTFTSAGIEQFVSLVRNAEAVFCNSLHGVCLSILFHREFYAFEHAGGGGKYRDLCGKLGLEKRFVRIDGYEEDAPIDWRRVEELRQGYKRESLEWLDQAIRDALPQ